MPFKLKFPSKISLRTKACFRHTVCETVYFKPWYYDISRLLLRAALMNVSVSWQTQSTSLFPLISFLCPLCAQEVWAHSVSLRPNAMLFQSPKCYTDPGLCSSLTGRHVTGKHSQIVLASSSGVAFCGKGENEILSAKSWQSLFSIFWRINICNWPQTSFLFPKAGWVSHDARFYFIFLIKWIYTTYHLAARIKH